jgi:hypothetical protein
MEARKKDLEKILGVLTHMRLRPGMYFSSDMPGVYAYLNGFKTACHLLGVDISKNESVIWSERGWEAGALHPIKQMQEKGMSEAEITEELLTSLILALVRSYSISTQPVLDVHNRLQDYIEEQENQIKSGEDKEFKLPPAIVQSDIERWKKALPVMERLEKDLGISGEAT